MQTLFEIERVVDVVRIDGQIQLLVVLARRRDLQLSMSNQRALGHLHGRKSEASVIAVRAADQYAHLGAMVPTTERVRIVIKVGNARSRLPLGCTQASSQDQAIQDRGPGRGLKADV